MSPEGNDVPGPEQEAHENATESAEQPEMEPTPTEGPSTQQPPTVEAPPERRRIQTLLLAAVAMLLLVAAVGAAALLTTRFYYYRPVSAATYLDRDAISGAAGSEVALQKKIRQVEAEARQLHTRLRALVPRGIYIVVDTHRNRLYVKKGDKVVHEAICSTGSGLLLRDPGSDRQWIFDTPRGVFRIHRKVADPVWTKPDWAFVEEGKPLPEKWAEREDKDTLGAYALHFGDGYMIHGTLYQRYLGRSLTHGCVRLGDEDLKTVYNVTPLGALVYIY